MKITNQVTAFQHNPKGFTTSHRKEGKDFEKYSVLTIEKGVIEERIDCRIYFTKSTVYCAVWVRAKNSECWPSGTGKAGGYGYDKPSAAIETALENAGYKFKNSFAGVGQQGIEAALKAVAEYHKMGKITIMRHHG